MYTHQKVKTGIWNAHTQTGKMKMEELVNMYLYLCKLNKTIRDAKTLMNLFQLDKKIIIRYFAKKAYILVFAIKSHLSQNMSSDSQIPNLSNVKIMFKQVLRKIHIHIINNTSLCLLIRNYYLNITTK